MMTSAPSQVAAALPPIGPLLGSAFDRAVFLIVRSWRVVGLIVAYVLIVGSYQGSSLTIDAGVSISKLPLFVWAFFGMANSLRLVFDPAFRMDAGRVASMFGTSLVAALTIVIANLVAVFAVVERNNPILWLAAIPGIVAGIWLWTRWCCAAAIAARGSSVSDSLQASWRLTATSVWPSLAITLAGIVLPVAAGGLYGLVWGAALTAVSRLDPALARLDYASAGAVAFASINVVISAYMTQATQLSLCMWLKALEAAQPAEPVQAAVAPA